MKKYISTTTPDFARFGCLDHTIMKQQQVMDKAVNSHYLYYGSPATRA